MWTSTIDAVTVSSNGRQTRKSQGGGDGRPPHPPPPKDRTVIHSSTVLQEPPRSEVAAASLSGSQPTHLRAMIKLHCASLMHHLATCPRVVPCRLPCVGEAKSSSALRPRAPNTRKACCRKRHIFAASASSSPWTSALSASSSRITAYSTFLLRISSCKKPVHCSSTGAVKSGDPKTRQTISSFPCRAHSADSRRPCIACWLPSTATMYTVASLGFTLQPWRMSTTVQGACRAARCAEEPSIVLW
mmetsp:Transcript_60852/g.188406  ORF Transcript_60852/g.188406 Transcript_60852/m.188406 type:complete len:245 (+) Transcript_60852:25-759(+)